MTTKKPLRALGYARLSRATEESTSIERQLDLARSTAEARGWEYLGAEVDEDVSATKTRLDRPGLSRLRARVAAGEADVVVVWRVDRVARSLSDLLTVVEEFEENGVALVSATEAFDATTAGGKAMLSMLGVFAALEAATVRDRVIASREALRKARRFPGGRVPYGYRTAPNPEGPGRILVPDEFEAAIVREAAERVLAGESLYRVVNDFNSRGVKPRSAATWAISSLKWLLVGDSILGRVTVGGDVMRDDSGLPLEVWEPIIDGDTSARLREALGGPRRNRAPGKPRRRATRLLSGLIVCSGCGRPTRVNTRQGGDSYACMAKSDGRRCKHPVAIGVDLIDQYIEAEYLRRFGFFRHVEARVVEADRGALVAIEEAIRDTTAALATADEGDEADLLARLRDLKRRRDDVREETEGPRVEYIETDRTVAEVWAESDIDTRRAMLRSALAEFVLLPGVRGRRGLDISRLAITWKGQEAL